MSPAKQQQQPFNGLFSRTTWVSRYQKGKTNLDFTGARDSEWQWHQLSHMQVCTSLQTDNHASTPPLCFLQAGCPSCRPTNSVKALKASTAKQQEVFIFTCSKHSSITTVHNVITFTELMWCSRTRLWMSVCLKRRMQNKHCWCYCDQRWRNAFSWECISSLTFTLFCWATLVWCKLITLCIAITL